MLRVLARSRETGALELMDTLKGPRRGYSSAYLKRKVDEAYERAALLAEGMGESIVAWHIRKLKGPQ